MAKCYLFIKKNHNLMLRIFKIERPRKVYSTIGVDIAKKMLKNTN